MAVQRRLDARPGVLVRRRLLAAGGRARDRRAGRVSGMGAREDERARRLHRVGAAVGADGDRQGCRRCEPLRLSCGSEAEPDGDAGQGRRHERAGRDAAGTGAQGRVRQVHAEVSERQLHRMGGDECLRGWRRRLPDVDKGMLSGGGRRRCRRHIPGRRRRKLAGAADLGHVRKLPDAAGGGRLPDGRPGQVPDPGGCGQGI